MAARNFTEAVRAMHAKMDALANAQPAVNVDAKIGALETKLLKAVDTKISVADAKLIHDLKTNPNLLKKMTGTGKPK